MALRKRHATGYTLIELMAVLAIASALLVVAIPMFRTQVQNSRMSAAATDLLSTFMSAKSEAVGRNNFVTVCISNKAPDPDDLACADISNVKWEDGWLSFVDVNADRVLNNDEDILQVHPPLSDGTTARATGTLANSITYRPNGLTNLNGTQSLVICDARGFDESSRILTVSILGKVSILKVEESGVGTCLR
jgi:type IV fimbrial biogenesis protein FimT